MKKYLWKFELDYGRMGTLSGLFFATEERVSKAIGEEIYYGEVLGKHSEVYATLDENQLQKIELPDNVAEFLENELGETVSGTNPIWVYEEQISEY